MKTLDFVFVDHGLSTKNDTHKFKSGKEIFIEVGYDPTKYAKVSGELAAKCMRFPQIPKGSTVYHPYTNTETDADRIVVTVDKKDLHIIPVPYAALFCWINDGKIEMLNDFILVEPRTKSNQDEVDRLAKEGIKIATAVEVDKNYGTIKYCADENLIGVEIAFNGKYEAYVNTIEGKDYYTMKLKDVYIIDDHIKEQLNSRS
jgi:hypothetical protein